MKKNSLFTLLFAFSTVVAMAQVINFTPASGAASAISGPDSRTYTFDAGLSVPFGPGFIDVTLDVKTIGSVVPGTASAVESGVNGSNTKVTITVTIPAGLTVNSTVTVPVTLTHNAAGGFGPYTASGNFIFTITAVLSAEMVTFKGKSAEGKNQLEWATASEKDNNKFVVEQSVNGLDFKAIGEVKGSGTSQTENRYSFTDESPSKAINYYRLKTIDMNGTEALSKVVTIANKGAFDAKATASAQGAKVSIVADQDGEATVDILNLNGQIVSTQSVAVANGVSEYVLPFNQTGLFIVRVSNGKSSVSTKLMKY